MVHKNLFHESLNQFGYRRGARGGREHHLCDFAAQKWERFGDKIDLRNKSALDVGCAAGYSSIEAWARGARFVHGFDIRKEIIKIGEDVRNKLGLDEKTIRFESKDIFNFDFKARAFDFIICLGVAHYVPSSSYRRFIFKLAYSCREAVILEGYFLNTPELKIVEWRPNDNSPIPNLKSVYAASIGVIQYFFEFVGIRIVSKDFSYHSNPERRNIRGIIIGKKMPEIKISESDDLKDYPSDTILIAPTRHPELRKWLDIWEENRRRKDREIPDKMKKIREEDKMKAWKFKNEFIPFMFFPLIYNRNTMMLADGFHKLKHAIDSEMPEIKVRIADSFIKREIPY